MTEILTRELTWSAAEKVFVGEISEIGADRAFQQFKGGTGFPLRSVQTEKMVLFRLSNVVRDYENDVVYWEFEPVQPADADARVKLLND